MKIRNTLLSLLHYYSSTRGVGHTRTMMEGVKNVEDTMVLVHSFGHSRSMAAQVGDRKFISLDSLDALRGAHRPLAIDNFALQTIFSEALKRMQHLEKHEDIAPFILSVCINGIDKAELLSALYNQAKTQGMGDLHYDPTPMTIEAAREILLHQTRFDYFVGRALKIDLSTDTLNIALYERDNGTGVALRIVADLHARAEVPK